MINDLELATVMPKQPYPNNLTRDERRALCELRHNNDIVIKPADKGSAVVIMNRADYIKEAHNQLSDTQYYHKLDCNPTHNHNHRIHAALDEMLSHKELPKIHKGITPTPGWTIISANDCPTERISQLVDHFLQDTLLFIKSYLKDTSDMIIKLDKLTPRLLTQHI